MLVKKDGRRLHHLPAGNFSFRALVRDAFGNMAPPPEDPPVWAANPVEGVGTDEQT